MIGKINPKKLTHERLTHLFSYDPDTGHFFRRVSVWASAKAGVKVGSKHSCGYLECMIDRERHFLHRLAWFYVHKKWPDGVIDHINRDKKDNRISNLRDVSQQGNIINSPLKSTNKTGVKGVHVSKKTQKYVAQITVDKKCIHLGSFDLLENAIAARQQAERRVNELVYGPSSPSVDKNKEVDKQRTGGKLVKTSRYRGVVLHRDGRWGAQVMHLKKNHWLGIFDTEESAHQAYLKAKNELTGGNNG